IYGHNRINGTMFGTLKKALSKSWVDNKDVHIIKLITKDYVIRYQIFSSYTIKEEGYYLRTSFKSLNYDKFLSTLLERSKYSFNTSVSDTDNIITLSTCSSNNTKRTVVHAKMISMTKHR
ncbi:MAG TPA: class B sortase, partial [Bacilli bacterium]|nr:class B sortase [Bacilli bacterium]